MKKIICLICIISIIFSFVACVNTGGNGDPTSESDNPVQVVNPVSTTDKVEAASILGLNTISFPDGFNTGIIALIAGENEILSFNIVKDEQNFNVRIAKANNTSADISGVYLSDKDKTSAIYDSADYAISPSIEAAADNETAKAFCEWNGYYLSVSSSDMLSLDNIANVTSEIAKTIISTDNILNSEEPSQFPGMIASDVHFSAINGELLYGLKEEDAAFVKNLIEKAEWGYDYDNISDYTIAIDKYSDTIFYYDFGGGIITKNQNTNVYATKLAETDKDKMNSIIVKYIVTSQPDDIILRYEQEIAETYPLRLTVRELLK